MIDATKKERALEWVRNCNTEFDNLSERIKLKLLDFYRLYRTFENEKRPAGQSNIFIPKLYEIVENKTPVVIANDPKIIVAPRNNEVLANVGIIRDSVDYWWMLNKMKRKLEGGVKDAFIYGISPWRVDWKQETEMVEMEQMTIDEETGEEIVVKEYEGVVVREYPTAKPKSVFDIKVDPRCETFQDGVGVIEVIKDVRMSDLLEFGEEYDLSDISDVDAEMLTDKSYDKYGIDVEDGKGINDLAEEIDKNRIVLFEFWGKFAPTEGGKEMEYVITTIAVDNEPKYVIRCKPNKLGFRPYAKIDDRVVRGEFYSIGELEPLEGAQIEYNNIRNGRLDFNNAINYPEWLYNVNAGINPANLIHRPNNLIAVDLPIGTDIASVIRPVDKPQPPISGLNEEAQLNRDFQSISQTIDFTDRGGSRGFTNTATGVKSRDNQMSQRANNIVSHLEDFIGEIGMMWLGLAEMFAEDEIEIRRSRTEDDMMAQPEYPLKEYPYKFTNVSKEVLQKAVRNYEIIVEGGSTTANSAAGKAQEATNIANTSVQFKSQGVNIDMTKVYKDILMYAFQKSNPEEYILPDAPVQPEPETASNPPMQPSQPVAENQYQ